MTEIAYKCQRIHVTMTHGMLYLKTCPRPTFLTKVRHGTQLLAHASNSFGCIRTWARSAQVFLAPHTSGPRDVPRCGALSLLQKDAALQGESSRNRCRLNVKLCTSVTAWCVVTASFFTARSCSFVLLYFAPCRPLPRPRRP